MCRLTDLPAETLLGIYSSCSSVHDVLNLSQTCRRLHALLPSSQKLSILLSIAEAQAGPVFDIVQLLTINDVQAVHEIRQPPLSYPLLRDIISVARTAQEWEEIYPIAKWDEKYADRRVLSPVERYSLRRATYRLWLFSRAFHTYNHPRESRLHPIRITERCRLLRAWPTEELAEIEDFRGILRSVLESTIVGKGDMYCEPGAKSERHHQGLGVFPFASLTYAKSTALNCALHTSPGDKRFTNRRPYGRDAPGFPIDMYGWVDDVTRFYVLEDLMKLDPEQVLSLLEGACLPLEAIDKVGPLGEEWFANNGETFAQTFEMVMADRGEDAQEIRDRIAQGDLGIAKWTS